MKKHFILKPLPAKKARGRYFGVLNRNENDLALYGENKADSHIKWCSSNVHELDFYLDEETKELTGRDGDYVANIYKDTANVFWWAASREYYRSVTGPDPDNLTEENLGALLWIAWDVNPSTMQKVKYTSFEIIRASDGVIMEIKIP